MRLMGVVLLALLGFAFKANAGTIVLEGKYQQKNVYVINSISADGVGFCVFEVTVNGQITSDETNSNAFEVDLSVYGFKLGDDVVVTIKYKDGCEPKIINPGALEPSPTFETTDIRIDNAGMLSWETLNEQGRLPFVIQQFKWNKWVNVGEVMGNGTSVKNTYSFQTTPISGVNRFRVMQRSQENKNRTSKDVEYTSEKPEVTFIFEKKEKRLVFSADTNYELYNAYGQIIKRGFGSTCDVSNMGKGEYYISFDATTQKFEKK